MSDKAKLIFDGKEHLLDVVEGSESEKALDVSSYWEIEYAKHTSLEEAFANSTSYKITDSYRSGLHISRSFPRF